MFADNFCKESFRRSIHTSSKVTFTLKTGPYVPSTYVVIVCITRYYNQLTAVAATFQILTPLFKGKKEREKRAGDKLSTTASCGNDALASCNTSMLQFHSSMGDAV